MAVSRNALARTTDPTTERRGKDAGGSPACRPGTPGELSNLAGRLVELSGAGAAPLLTLAFGIVHEAQLLGEPAAWIALPGSTFFPPDVAAGGVDLAALPVVRAKDALRAARAADQLARSGAFGLLVIDLGGGELPLAAQSRLAGLAQKHETAIVCLTRKHASAPSLGSLVSLRAEATRRGLGPGRYACELTVIKDKRRGPGARHAEVCHGPDGLR